MTLQDPEQTSIEAIVREALSGVAVTAFARGIGLSVHFDARLPQWLTGDAGAVTAYLHEGMARTVESSRVSKVALSFWREGAGPDCRVVLEACRAFAGRTPPVERLADLWALPLGDQRVRPLPHRSGRRMESVLIPLPLDPATGSALLADKWRPTFAGRYLLIVGDIPIDTDRLMRSLEAMGLEAEITATTDAALEIARRRADAGKSVDLLLIDTAPLEEAKRLARAFRDDPRLEGALIGLSGVSREEVAPPGSERLFDNVRAATRPWRRQIDVFRELLEQRARASGAGPGGSPGGTFSAMPDLSGRRLLIAEDVETNQVLLNALLEPTGAAIETVSSGEAAVDRHAADPADLIVMDLQMPGMDGFAAARGIRALPPPAGEVPILALTAYAGSPDRQRALAAGMNAYLAKPVVVSELYDLLRRLLPEGKTG